MADPHSNFIIDKSDLARYRAVMKQFRMNVTTPTRFLNGAGELIIRKTMEAFEQERDPNTGEPWEDLADSTKARRGRIKKTKKGLHHGRPSRHALGRGTFKSGVRKGRAAETGRYKILQDTGLMRNSLTKKVSIIPPAVAVGFSDKKAPWHHFGVNRGGKGDLPARPMLPEGRNAQFRAELMRMLIAQVRHRIGLYVR